MSLAICGITPMKTHTVQWFSWQCHKIWWTLYRGKAKQKKWQRNWCFLQSFSSSWQQIPNSKFPCSIPVLGVHHPSDKNCSNLSSLSLWEVLLHCERIAEIYAGICGNNLIQYEVKRERHDKKMQMVLLRNDTPFDSISSQLQTLVQHGLAGNWTPCSAFRAHADHLTGKSLQSLWYSGRNY